jgi:hypothetical protein
MIISDIEEETTDLDWFGLDQQGSIGHFTTGGFGALPRSVASSKEDLESIYEYFRRLPLNATVPVVNPRAMAVLATKDDKAREKYLQDFLQMASRGLYSFNYKPTGKRPSPYFLVAKPENPLHINDVPGEIQAVLRKTILPGIIFANDDTVSEEAAR